MAEETSRAEDYSLEDVSLVRSALLYLATMLGDLLSDIVVVGGLVPSLVIDQENLPEGAERHVGTKDLDIGFEVAILSEQRYREISQRLREAGFSPDTNEQGNMTRQRWKVEDPLKVTVDFLIPPSQAGDIGGTIRNIEEDFAAVITPGLDLAFKDRVEITLSGKTPKGEEATRHVWVCGPGAYVVLKSLAFRNRGRNKDAYDLYYIIRNFGSGVKDIASALEKLVPHTEIERAISILREDFQRTDSLGPMRVAEFAQGAQDEDLQADVVGFVSSLLQVIDEKE